MPPDSVLSIRKTVTRDEWVSAYRPHIERVLAGNKNAFAEIVAMFNDMAHSVANARLGDAALAEDAVQEAFLAAFIKLPLLRDPDAFPGWFRTILIRHCDRIRARHERAVPSRDEDAAVQAWDDADPCRLYTRQLDRLVVRRILETLPGVAREACIQRYVHGRPYDDIARLLNVPEGTVKRRLHDAKQRIMAEFGVRRGRSVRLGYLPISDHLLAMVAHQMHDRADYDLHLTRFLSWASLVRALRGELLDAAFVMVPLAMALRNQGLPILYVLDGHHDGSAVTVRQGGERPDIGEGSTMALPHCISTHRLLLQAILGGPGAQPDPATRYISPSYVISSLSKHEIDGFLCSEPWHTKSEAQGEGRVLARSGEVVPGHICCVLVVREGFARSRPDLTRRFVSALAAAGEYIRGHPAESADIQARYTGVDREVAEHVLRKGYITFTDLAPDRGRAVQVMDLALKAGILTLPCDLNSFMAQEFAEAT